MTDSLKGKRIVIAGSQKTAEMSEIIMRQGGTPIVRPMQGIAYASEDELRADVERMIEDRTDWYMFTTGIGLETLRKRAEQDGHEKAFLEVLAAAKVVSRGYRTFGFLRNMGIQPVVTADDGSLRNIVEKLSAFDLGGQRVWLQLHGLPDSELLDYAKDAGADVRVTLPYRYQRPDPDTLITLVRELKDGAVDAVCFTTRAQIQYLFDYAKELGIDEELRNIFAERVLPVAVGKVTAEGLLEEGLGQERIIVPNTQRMGGMVIEIANYYEAMQE